MIAALLFATALAGPTWQRPPEAILEVLHAADLPDTWASPGARHLLLATALQYPPLEDRVTAMVPLAGIRVDARTNSVHGRRHWIDPQVLDVDSGDSVPIALPPDTRVVGIHWSADGARLALELYSADHIGLWVGRPDGNGAVIADLAVNPLLGSAVSWMPDQRRLLVRRIADRGPRPTPPVVPEGPIVRTGDGDRATSTYEARDVLEDAHDEALFSWYATSGIALVDADSGAVTPIGGPAVYTSAGASPDGRYLLVERLVPPWSHRHAWWRFAQEAEVWTPDGERVHTVASLPLADSVPIHGVPEGPRNVWWRPTDKATLLWVEALDGGDWSREVPHRDRLMVQKAPFRKPAREVVRTTHRATSWWWTEEGTLLVEAYERARRWEHTHLVDVDRRKSRPLFDRSRNDRYGNPGRPVMRRLAHGGRVLETHEGSVFFQGSGSSPQGDRPFLDRRSLATGEVARLFRSDPAMHERFVAFRDPAAGTFLARRQAPDTPPNTWLVTLGEARDAPEGEARFARTERAVTTFADPVPQLQGITRRTVTYEREDGVPLSFQLWLPAGYQEGEALPTVVYAYPREFSDPETAGQVRGSDRTWTRLRGASHLFFLLQGYAILHNTRMPVIGDPDTAYDTFVEQLVSGAEAAVEKAVALGVTDRERIGVMGHSHGGLMTVTLLAHSDLFKAGIARSGAYNHTIRPFGFQSERRTLWEAPETYLHLSPVMHAPKIDAPLLLIHGAMDENPGTVPLHSERLFEAVRGTGGQVRLLMLPYEGHGYRSREAVEHTLHEQLAWFDQHVRANGATAEVDASR